MASKTPLGCTIYAGTFIHCLSLDHLEVLENAAVGVDEKGIIAFVEKDVSVEQVKYRVRERYGWAGCEVVYGGSGESTTFFFPGFVGEWTVLLFRLQINCINAFAW